MNIYARRYTVYLYSISMGEHMKVEITIDRKKKLPDGAEPTLEAELLRRLNQKYENCQVIVRRAGVDGLSVFGGIDGDK